MKVIALQVNKYFTELSWQNKILSKIPDIHNKYSIRYFKSKNEIKNDIESINFCFALSFNPDLFKNAKQMRMLYIGTSDADVLEEKIKELKFNYFTSKGLASQLIAEYSLWAALNLIRNLSVLCDNRKKRKWDQKPFVKNSGILNDYKIGVLGLGFNGMKIARLFKQIGCEIFGCSKSSKNSESIDHWFQSTELIKFLSQIDILIISLPLRPDTTKLIGKNEIEVLKKESYIINTSRGLIIDEPALINALKNGDIKGACIDVACTEPVKFWSKLWRTPNLILTPHIAGNINMISEIVQYDFLKKLLS